MQSTLLKFLIIILVEETTAQKKILLLLFAALLKHTTVTATNNPNCFLFVNELQLIPKWKIIIRFLLDVYA